MSSLQEYRQKRDFRRTREPRGSAREDASASLQFVIQKHDASRLHYDLRLELDGVMKSWAVPKGPSLDPSVKRLAIEVEDHPIEYNEFEGTIPQGEYGGGTVMIWDRGSYAPVRAGTDPVATIRRGLTRGKVDIELRGERLRGGFSLIRTRREQGARSKAEWLLVKIRDAHAAADIDVTAEETTSVVTGREMDEIATDPPGWSTNRAPKRSRPGAPTPARSRSAPAFDPAAIEPMYATLSQSIPAAEGWVFEPKYDGIRVLAFVTRADVRLVTRNGKEKAKQFPEVVEALRTFAARARRDVVLDGEIVALDEASPARFQRLQGRMHLTGGEAIARAAENTPAALIAFDMLVDGSDVLLHEPWTTRRKQLEQRLRNRTSGALRVGETLPGDGERMLRHARESGWEGIIAKRTDASYRPGARSRDWLKLKVEFRQEFVVGGFTEPRESRQHLGALLLGYYDGDDLVYAGHTGGGFSRDTLRDVHRRLEPLERSSSPFSSAPKTNERPHWVAPEIVVEVKFSEWTTDGKLRHPIFLGVRDDKDPREVRREPISMQAKDAASAAATERAAATAATRRRQGTAATGGGGSASDASAAGGEDVLAQLIGIEGSGGRGALRFGRGATLDVSSLDKLFFPEAGYTKGDLMRYYAVVAEHLLPALRDRPLVLRRTPAGVHGQAFFQQRPGSNVPPAVRTETIRGTDGKADDRLVGGSLPTLLYLVQLGCISMDPWHSRIRSIAFADYSYLDLDPQPDAGFSRVLEVGRWVRDELAALGLHAALKTSGSRGLHIAIPLPRRTTYDTALLLAQIVATRVARRHPREATVERAVKARDRSAVYVDYLQNVQGKSIASVYSVRARPEATVSTPLDWPELDDEALDPRSFTMETVPERVAQLGDLWEAQMRRPNSAAVLRAAGGA